MRPSQNLPLPPKIYPFLNTYVRPSQNLPPPSQNIAPFQYLYATLPESTSPSQNIPPFQQIYMCDSPRILSPPLPEYRSIPLLNKFTFLSEYTPLFNNYMRPSQNLPLPPRIYPLFNKFTCATLPESSPPPLPEYRSIPLFNKFTFLSEYTPLFNNYLRPSQNLPSHSEYTPLFNKCICAILPESIPPSQNTLSFSTNNLHVRPSQNLSLPPRIYPLSTPICGPPRIHPSLPEYTPIQQI